MDLNELVEITINHKGIDIKAVVTLEEANILMNDEAAAAEYAEAMMAQQENVNEPPDEHPEVNNDQEVAQCSKKRTDNFMTKEATLLFLRLRRGYSDKFNDKKTQKNSLWQKIAGEMRQNGYDIPEGREGAERCRQKFANLQRSYLSYIKHIKTTGTEKRDPPPYFDEMDVILGNKDKVNPPYLEDSLDTSSPSMDELTTPSCSSFVSTSNIQKEIKNRFSSSRASIRPSTNFNTVLELLKEQQEQLRNDREKHMRVFENAITTQNEQRERFLQLLEKSEKRNSSSDE